MPGLRRLLAGGGPPRPDGSNKIITLLAILVVVGALPAIVVSVGAAAVSTGTVAAVWLLSNRFGVTLG